MSLNRNQVSETRQELHANLELAGVGVDEVARNLDWPVDRVSAALDISHGSPRDVWLLRDYLDRAVRAGGRTPHPWSTLTEENRGRADAWFDLYDLDES